jgi:hypothetical protein
LRGECRCGYRNRDSSLTLPSILGYLDEEAQGRLPSKHFGTSNVVGLGIDDNVRNWIKGFSGIVGFTTERGSCIFGGKIGPHIGVRMIDDFDRSSTAYTVDKEA